MSLKLPRIVEGSIPPWFILHVPHASTVIPAELRHQFVLSDADLRAEIAQMTDHATDELFGADWPPDQIVRADVSRLVVDVERFEDDQQEAMASRGLGVIYTATSSGSPLRRSLSSGEREALLNRWYRPHHRQLSDKISSVLERFGRVLIIDAHSFPQNALPYEDPRLARPEICIGTDPVHTPDEVRDGLMQAFSESGFTVGVNEPFSGAIVPSSFYRIDPRCHSVMIEVRRDLYVNDSGQPLPGRFAAIQRGLRRCLLLIST